MSSDEEVCVWARVGEWLLGNATPSTGTDGLCLWIILHIKPGNYICVYLTLLLTSL